jgi:hypothetical protein
MFWARWSKEYLSNLQVRQKWTRKSDNLRVNDIVLLKEETNVRGQFRLGRVTDVSCGKDGLVRTARLLVGDSGLNVHGKRISDTTYLERPIHKLILLFSKSDQDTEART